MSKFNRTTDISTLPWIGQLFVAPKYLGRKVGQTSSMPLSVSLISNTVVEMSSKIEPADFQTSNDVDSTKRRRVSSNKQQTQQQQEKQPTTKLVSSPLMPKNNNKNTTTNSTSMCMGPTLTANIVASINHQGLRTHDVVMRRRESTETGDIDGNYNNNGRNKADGTSSIGEELNYRDDIGAALTLATMHMLPPLARKRKTEEEEEEEKEEKTLHRYPPAASHMLRKEAPPLVMVFKGASILKRQDYCDEREKGEEGGEMGIAGSQLLQYSC